MPPCYYTGRWSLLLQNVLKFRFLFINWTYALHRRIIHFGDIHVSDNQLFDKYGRLIPAGEVIFRENEDGEEMYIIQSGKVRISKNIGGKEHILAVLGKGDFFGETAIFSRIRRTATATAVRDARLLSFDRPGFRGMIEKNSKIAMNMIDELCRRLKHANMQIQHLKRKNAANLVALDLFYAFEESDQEDGKLALNRIMDEIPLSLEIPAEEVKGIIENFAGRGLVTLEENRLGLPDKDALREFGESSGS